MSTNANIFIHPSQWPDAVHRDLCDSLRRRAVNHKFLYDSVDKARKWLDLHEACSPARTRPEVATTYQRAFESAAQQMGAGGVHVIGLGCGSGAKDGALIRCLAGRTACFTAVDVSAALVETAWRAVGELIPSERCFPIVCDLATAEDLPAVIQERTGPASARLITFFGMLPNFEPAMILPKLAALARPGDYLLCSANLAPGDNYRQGVEKVLPLYDNALTRDWLMTFLLDLGVDAADGALNFCIEERPVQSGLLRIAAHFQFRRRIEVRVETAAFVFEPADVLRLFFSYRHTPGRVRGLLAPHDLTVMDQWISPCGEEGVFLARRGLGS